MPEAGRAAQYLRRAPTEATRTLQTNRAAWLASETLRGGGIAGRDATRCGAVLISRWGRAGERDRGDEERFKRGRPEAQLLGSDVRCSGRHAIIAAEQLKGPTYFFNQLSFFLSIISIILVFYISL
jgi:hypothetical protein